MKTKQKLLAFNKIKIAKVTSYTIVGKGTSTITRTPQCMAEESRSPKGGERTQTYTYDDNCESSLCDN